MHYESYRVWPCCVHNRLWLFQPVTCPIIEGSCWWDAMRLTMALPTITPSAILAHDGIPLPREGSTRSVFVNGGLRRSSAAPKLGSGLFGHVPAGKYQDGRVALQDTRQGLGPLDAQIDGVGFNG